MEPGQTVVHGRVAWIFEDDYDVDMIVGVENIKTYDPDKLLPFLMATHDPMFTASVRQGDFLVGGRNFGYGHPHYQGMIAMRHVGINTIVADSFASGFHRGEVANGMLLIECPDISRHASRWQDLEIDLGTGTLRGPDFCLPIVRPSERTLMSWQAGGTFNLLASELQNASRSITPYPQHHQ